MMQEIKKVAEEKGLSVELEVASSLLATFVEKEALQVDTLSQRILKHTFTSKEAVEECKRKRRQAFENYEIEKLRLFISFEDLAPRYYKENFMAIDVKEMSKKIRAELKAEAKKNKQAE